MLYDHIAALRRQAQFRDARFVLILEANLGSQAQMCAHYLLRRDPSVDVVCSKSHTYGVFTLPGDPERYVVSMCDRLAGDGLFMHDRLVVANRYNTSQSASERLGATLREFKRQLLAFRAVHIVPTSLNSQVRVIFTGKADKDGKRSRRLKDDMCMAMLFGYFYYLRLHGPHKLVATRNAHSMLEINPETNPTQSAAMRLDERDSADEEAPPMPQATFASGKRKRQ